MGTIVLSVGGCNNLCVCMATLTRFVIFVIKTLFSPTSQSLFSWEKAGGYVKQRVDEKKNNKAIKKEKRTKFKMSRGTNLASDSSS